MSPLRTGLFAAALLAASASFACHKRCEPGFISQGGGCVAFVDPDAGEGGDGGRADTGVPGGDAGRFDAGRTDSGPPRDSGPVPDGGFPDSGVDRDATITDRGPIDAGPYDAGPGGYILRGTTVLPMTGVAPYSPGEVRIAGNRIACVGGMGVCAAGDPNAPVIETGGVILPGLVNAHNHVAYDWLPEWVPGHFWNDSPQWRGSAEYDVFIAPYSDNHNDANSLCAMTQWGEIRALVNGMTTTFGTPTARTCYRWLVRNAELSVTYSGFARDAIRSNTLGITTVNMADAATILASMMSGDTLAYMVHLAEGISTRSHDEWVTLMTLGLLQPQTVVIHGVAMTPDDFVDMGLAGAKLVWSPSSNIALYNQTTDVAAAKNAGVLIALAPDWTPSGRDDSLGEIRFAKDYAATRWPNLFTDAELVTMSTYNPAVAMGVDGDIGSLQAGLLADLLVLDDQGMGPYGDVVRSRPQHIRLVVLDGVPSYGNQALLDQVPGRPATCYDFDACGTPKRGCWVDAPTGPVDPTTVASVIQGFYPAGAYGLFECNATP